MLVLLQKEGKKRGREEEKTDSYTIWFAHGGMERNLTDLSHTASAGLRSVLDSIYENGLDGGTAVKHRLHRPRTTCTGNLSTQPETGSGDKRTEQKLIG